MSQEEPSRVSASSKGLLRETSRQTRQTKRRTKTYERIETARSESSKRTGNDQKGARRAETSGPKTNRKCSIRRARKLGWNSLKTSQERTCGFRNNRQKGPKKEAHRTRLLAQKRDRPNAKFPGETQNEATRNPHTKDLARILDKTKTKTARTSIARCTTPNHANPKVCSTGQNEKGTEIIAKASRADTKRLQTMQSFQNRYDPFWRAPNDTGNHT